MTSQQVALLIGGILLTAIFAIMIPLIIIDLKKNKDKYIITKEEEEKRFDDDGEILSFHAEVADMICGVNTIGYQSYKQPKAIKHFVITFKSDSGEISRIPVSEELYGAFDIGLAGTLTLIDGQLHSFLPDQE